MTYRTRFLRVLPGQIIAYATVSAWIGAQAWTNPEAWLVAFLLGWFLNTGILGGLARQGGG
jgi:hypothetical protein